MADLQSCYFCGAPDELGEYAVVPPRLGGGDRSVVLCPDCKTKLLRVMEPLIERAEAGADAGSGNEGGSESGSQNARNEPAAESTTPDAGGITMSPGAESSDDDTDADADTAASTPAGDTGGAGDAVDPTADAPPSYRRAVRMLSNRPFPLELHEVESMLANAYDLEREGIDAVLERAESEGRLVVEDGEIREA